jgi:hypothetical protein
MEGVLINLVLLVIVFAIIFGVIRYVPIEAWLKQIANLVAGGIFVILLIVYVLLPLLHHGPLLTG